MIREFFIIIGGIFTSLGLTLVMFLLLRSWMVKRGRAPRLATFLALLGGPASILIIALTHEESILGFFPSDLEIGFYIPLKEEALKAVFIFGVTRLKSVRDWVDGVFIGVAVGVSYTLVENFMFFMSAPTIDILVKMYFFRTLTLGHVLYSGLVGMAFGWQRMRPEPLRWFAVPVAFALAVAIHGCSNLTPFLYLQILLEALVFGFILWCATGAKQYAIPKATKVNTE